MARILNSRDIREILDIQRKEEDVEARKIVARIEKQIEILIEVNKDETLTKWVRFRNNTLIGFYKDKIKGMIVKKHKYKKNK